MRKIGLLLIAVLFSGALEGFTMNEDIKYEWLEEVESKDSLEFAERFSLAAKSHLQNHPMFENLKSEARAILYSKEKLLGISRVGKFVYNFWQDETYRRGLYRRMKVEDYLTGGQIWEPVLNLDQLAKDENENWVWRGMRCASPEYRKCLVFLSRGGKDATVMREYNLETKTFVTDGFRLPEAKMNVSWLDENSLFVATDFGSGTRTDSGYARLVKIWKRGTPISEAKLQIEARTKDIMAYGFVVETIQKKYALLSIRTSFFQEDLFWLREEKQIPFPTPNSADFLGAFNGFFFFSIQEDWTVGEKKYLAGSVLALPEEAVPLGEIGLSSLEVVFQPSTSSVFSSISFSRSQVYLGILENVQGKVLQGARKEGKWIFEEIFLGKNGVATIFDADYDEESVFFRYSDFLTPPSYFFSTGKSGDFKKIQQSPQYFDASGLEVHQSWVKSKDGVDVPYYLIHKKGLARNGKNPTLLYGYGGFMNPLLPEYMPLVGKSWLEKGGVYVLASIRGGGEFGPHWHRSALKENKQRSYDDFLAIAEDLIQKKITSPKNLGIRGGSNGGLLVGAAFTQRPDLFQAVICEVPLLDMLRYHLLLAGASWMEEYGDPEDPKMRQVIEKYSPFQNVHANKNYPEVFFLTSTKDDRVHPGHARKMVAKMTDLGHRVFYYENTEGGHGGVANLEQSILKHGLVFSYLWEKLSTP